MSTSDHTKKWRVKTKNSTRVQKWRQATKQRLVEAFGGRCGICGYDKECIRAYDFHHIDPGEKDFSLSKGNTVGWEKIVVEMRKCCMLCSNCHREVHDGYTALPLSVRRFDESYAKYKEVKDEVTFNLCACGKNKRSDHQFCSPRCFGHSIRKVDWDAIDLIGLVKATSNFAEVGRMLGVSSTVVRRRYNALIGK